MIQTINDIANAKEFKAELMSLLNNPVLQTALSVLQKENMPSFQIQMAPGMDAMQSVALYYAKICGAQAVLEKLQRLPYLTPTIIEHNNAMGRSWEWVGDSIKREMESMQDNQPAEDQTKKLPRKTISK